MSSLLLTGTTFERIQWRISIAYHQYKLPMQIIWATMGLGDKVLTIYFPKCVIDPKLISALWGPLALKMDRTNSNWNLIAWINLSLWYDSMLMTALHGCGRRLKHQEKYQSIWCLWTHWIYSGWRHQMETFSTLLALCAGNSPVTGEFPA